MSHPRAGNPTRAPAHGNSLRSIAMVLDNLGERDAAGPNLPTAVSPGCEIDMQGGAGFLTRRCSRAMPV
jgi:bisphosphoglycerate-dependent phosphoglycerate mutase